MKALILTQDACPRCESQKLFLASALKNKYVDDVVFIKKEDNPKAFAEWVQSTGTTQTPTTIFLEDEMQVKEVVSGFNPAKLMKAFTTHLG